MIWHIDVSVANQTLSLFKNGIEVKSWRIATATNGVGEQSGSECTPRGKHYIRAKIGHNAATNTVFVGRRATGETHHPKLREQYPDRDWILTRIMWLCGLEPGKNRLGKVDTMQRYVYIHGCPDDDVMGIPSSHGCVKMRNQDVIELFDLIPAGTTVNIIE